MIEMIVIDVDGTLTDGKVAYDANGIESRNFDVKDAFAITIWIKKFGKKAMIVNTGRPSEVIFKRAKQLGFQHIFQGVHNKLELLEEICEKEGIKLDQVAAIGDDLHDIKMLKKVALSFAPSNASRQILEAVKVVCKKNGGDGAVREMIEHICERDGKYEEFINL
jgi:3-deoxy-D-manno-octulosonate 8-phosphate phosphatase (KDO 8-P phosphatase)